MSRHPKDPRFILNMIIFVIALSLVVTFINWIINGVIFMSALYYSFVYTACCSFFCASLISVFYDRIARLPKVLFILAFLVLVVAGVLAGILLATFILERRIYIELSTLYISLLFGVVASTVMTINTVLKYNLQEKAVKLRQAETENEHLKRLESEARLAGLQAKLNPHFLFNTLNSLAALVYLDQEKAEKSIVRLSNVYRRILSISQQTFVSLREEIGVIKDYLELEKLRFQSQLEYEIIIPEELQEIPIPGLLLEPLVGNVIKHVLDRRQGTVRIVVSVTKLEEYLSIMVSDNGPGFDPGRMEPGYGLSSLQERLQLLYGERYLFSIDSAPGRGTTVKIGIPLNEVK